MNCSASRHGDANAFDHHRCRCPDAIRDKKRRRETTRRLRLAGTPMRMDATGARRRLQALAVMGWGLEAVVARTGLDIKALYKIRAGVRPRILRPTHEVIAAAFDDLCMTAGPAVRARTWAAKHGWAPPLAWDDDTIDDPSARPVGRRRPGAVEGEAA